jgi:transcriptional regulator with XRE-family HTH domain
VGGYVARVGERLKEERLLRGWSQRDLAREAGTTAETISSIETGQHVPRPSTLRKLAEGLGLEVRDFYREPAVPLVEAPREAGRAGTKTLDEWLSEGEPPSILSSAITAAVETWLAALSNPNISIQKRFGIRDAAIELFDRINARTVEHWETLPTETHRDIVRAIAALNKVPEESYRLMPDETVKDSRDVRRAERKEQLREWTRRIGTA